MLKRFFKIIKIFCKYSSEGRELFPFSQSPYFTQKWNPLAVVGNDSTIHAKWWTSMRCLFAICHVRGFLVSSAGKESACNAGDLASILGLGRSPGEGKGYPLQYSWASLVAQLVKNLPEMQKTWVQSLGWEDPLEKGKATHFSILVWRIPWTV